MLRSETVTIGIPCHNAERWIEQCVASAIAQSSQRTRTQIIVVDDGSTDRSAEIIRQFDDQIEIINSKNLGANAARNAVLQRATGSWIQYLDADDYLLPEKIASQLTNAQGDIIYSPVLIDGIATTISTDFDLYQRWFAWQLPQTGGALWRTEALRSLGGWNEAMPCCQEHELYLRAIQAGLEFTHAPAAGAVYRIWSEDSLCRRDPALTIRVRIDLIRNMGYWMTSRGLYQSQHARTAGAACFGLARDLAKIDLGAARRTYRELKTEGLIHPSGDAAPWKYRAVLKTLGFTRAERIAGALRS